MKKLTQHIAALFITAWVGGLWATGYLAVPVLFYTQPDRQLAGMLAGQMFTLMSYVGMVCGTYLLIHYFVMAGKKLMQWIVLIVATMLILTLIAHFGIQPAMADLKVQALPSLVTQSEFAGQFRMLHGISSILFLIQSLLGVVLVVKVNRLPC
ncbi:MAG: DUF4149 domain-containing protein [Gallionella sp.]